MQAVITVADPLEGSDPKQFWKSSYFLALRAALQDMRVLKLVQKIDGHVYNLNVYREEGVVYFDAYDPVLSQVFMSTLKIEDVSEILIPNSTDRERGAREGVDLGMPADPPAMYMRLVKLLSFDTKKQTGTRQLVCKRKFDHLQRITRKVSGHTVVLNVYEASIGQIYFEALLPKYCCKVRSISTQACTLTSIHELTSPLISC